jgi:hypothetical protein
MRTHTFHAETADCVVTPVGKFVEDREPHPFKVQIIPNSPLLPVETIEVNEAYYYIAAGEALDRYKEKYGLNPSEAWAMND